MKHTKTIVEYTKDSTKYEHVFIGVLTPTQIEQRMIMEVHVSRHNIGQHRYA